MAKKIILTLLKIIFLSSLLSGCIIDSNKKNNVLSEVTINNYSINELPYNERPYMLNYTIPLEWVEHVDQDSIPVYMWDNEPYYHPVFVSLYGIYFVEAYKRSNNAHYLKLAERIAAKLVENSREKNSDFYFPYNFDFYLVSELMEAPWYSGMAQGRLLSLFSRLYEVTGNNLYLRWAENTFRTLKATKNDNKNWVVMVDDNYLWIEEYPHEEPLHVLNGFIFAIYGVYDYYLVSKDNKGYKLLNAALTTVENNIWRYRNKGGISHYDLKHFDTKEPYHYTHIDQLNMLYSISSDIDFKNAADSLKEDFYERD